MVCLRMAVPTNAAPLQSRDQSIRYVLYEYQRPRSKQSPAGLAWDTPDVLGSSSPYTDKNETLRNEAWEAINIDAGMIAVPDHFVDEKDLPDSQRFVWDKSKSVYLLNGHHTLHCVVRTRNR